MDNHKNFASIVRAGVFCLIGLSLLLSAVEAQAEISAPKNPKSAKACALCHYRWIDTFFIEGRGTDLVPYQAQKVVATPEMCNSCHDGSIEDSRARMTIGHGHKTGVAPPAGMTIPEIFPLDDQGKVQCDTCHTAHGVPSGAGAETTIFMRTSNKDSRMCRMCHPGKDDPRPDHNHPMGMVKRPTPQNFLRLSAAAGKRADKISCESCHTAHGSTANALLIRSSRNASLCLACHTDKAMLTPEGRKRPGHVVNARPVTAKIPAALLNKGAEVGIDGEVICNTCHRVHGPQTGEDLLIMRNDQKASLCLACHADKRDLAETGHNLLKTAPQVKNLQGQTVTQAGICSACHLPHKAARELAPGRDYTTGICLSCHGKGQFAARPRIFGPSHPLGVTPFEAGSSGILYIPAQARKGQLTLPLYETTGVPSLSGKVTCATCHDPHRLSTASAGEGSSTKKAAAKAKNLFLRKSPLDLCQQCHEDKFAIANSKHNLVKTAPKEINLLKQTPKEAGLCGSCHLVHGGQGPFLWAQKLPTPENLKNPMVCLSCHSPKGAAAKKPIHPNSHPLNVSPTEKGLDTRLPLFGPDGRHTADGRMTCYTCHDPHRWRPGNPPGQAAVSEEGDAGNSFLRISNAPAAQLCADCHKQQALVENSDHDLKVGAPEVKNAQGLNTTQSGTCSACHLVHNGKNTYLLWAHDIRAGEELPEALCRSCHRKTGPVKARVPEIASHPSDMTFRNLGHNVKGEPGYFPLFDLADGKEIPNGKFSCVSCHNGHQWRRKTGASANQGLEEGDASSSFLRNSSIDLICKDCHGIQALYRYLYFHDPVNRNPETSTGVRLSEP